MITFKGPKLAAAREALEAMSPPPKIILELGTYVGCSAVSWGSILKDIWKDSPKDFAECRVYACELNEDFAKIARDFVKLAGLENVVQICAGKPAGDTMRTLKEEGTLTNVDMIFL
jgi:catechol O-methyltransferase